MEVFMRVSVDGLIIANNWEMLRPKQCLCRVYFILTCFFPKLPFNGGREEVIPLWSVYLILSITSCEFISHTSWDSQFNLPGLAMTLNDQNTGECDLVSEILIFIRMSLLLEIVSVRFSDWSAKLLQIRIIVNKLRDEKH